MLSLDTTRGMGRWAMPVIVLVVVHTYCKGVLVIRLIGEAIGLRNGAVFESAITCTLRLLISGYHATPLLKVRMVGSV